MQFENNKYVVRIATDNNSYEVVNKDTGVIEYVNTALPRCIIVATEYEEALKQYAPKVVEEPPHAPGSNVSSIFPPSGRS